MNVLLGNDARAVGHISWKWQQGKHTTSAAEWVELPAAARSSTRRGFATFPVGIHQGSLRHCFPDLDPLLGKCRFGDCSHRTEPGCTLADAVARGAIAPSRVASYMEICEELQPPPEEWSEGRGRARRDPKDPTRSRKVRIGR